MRLVIALLIAFAVTPTFAGHTPSQGAYRDCLDHGGTPATCACLRGPFGC
jgi:hypothetical protein